LERRERYVSVAVAEDEEPRLRVDNSRPPFLPLKLSLARNPLPELLVWRRRNRRESARPGQNKIKKGTWQKTYSA
jgi:hypothetical protein